MTLSTGNVKTVLFLLTFCFVFSASAQNLLQSRHTSYYTYIYQLTEKEAKKIYSNDLWKVDSTYFHTKVDSFLTDKAYDTELPEGHYLKTLSIENRQVFSITTVKNFEAFIFNNNADLSIQIYNLQGQLITNAEVHIGMNKLRFDNETQSYLDRKSNSNGLLKVKVNGFTAYYDLAREQNNSLLKRSAGKVVLGTPLKYVWLPVNFVFRLPIDGIKSIKRSWPVGTIYHSKVFFERSFKKMACLMNEDNCDADMYLRFNKKSTGYLIFSQPKYLPKDTVKFKAFLVNKRGRPIHKKLEVYFQKSYNEEIKLSDLRPYQDGGYTYEFTIHDSLNVRLDTRNTVSLRKSKYKEYIEGTFRYEEYELSKNSLHIRTEVEEHYKGKDIQLYIKATDENELNLMDARVEVTLSSKNIQKYFSSPIFIPDTLLTLKKRLDTSGETIIRISDSTFAAANFEYNIHVRLLNAENEAISKDLRVHYFYDLEKIQTKVNQDSIYVEYQKNGNSVIKQVAIFASDNFGNETKVYSGSSNTQFLLEPYYSSYIIRSDSITEEIDIANEPSLIQCFSERTSDSIYVLVNNPRKLPFMYQVYLKNARQDAGYTDSLKIADRSNTKQNYFVSIQYLWGGQVHSLDYQIPLQDKKLSIEVSEPKLVYPGQKTNIEILVKDLDGNPMENVDLTAYGVTKKFNYSGISVPDMSKKKKGKQVVNNFHFNDFELKNHPGLHLDYTLWKIMAGLDTIEYYKFLYPKHGTYRYEYETKDSITQFAPFVVSEGSITPVHVIYVDSKPVYFSWSDPTQSYAFAIDSGYHQIKLRTATKEIVLDSIYFLESKKTILSINEKKAAEIFSVKELTNKLNFNEKQLLYKFIVPYRDLGSDRFAYISDASQMQLLKPDRTTKSMKILGPLLGDLTYHELDSFSTSFRHEPYFEYEFSNKLLKMKGLDFSKYPEDLDVYTPRQQLSDTVITIKAYEKLWEEYLNTKRFNSVKYHNPISTSKDAGRLKIEFRASKENEVEAPLNVLLFRYDNADFLRVYSGNTVFIHDLKPGYYQLIFFYAGSKYHIEDSIYVKSNGLNFYQFQQPSKLKKDDFSDFVSSIIEKTIFQKNGTKEDEFRKIQQSYQQQFPYTGPGYSISGKVVEFGSDEPLAGISIILKGTNYGTTSLIDGSYSIRVPQTLSSLIFGFIGYASEEIPVFQNGEINVALKPDISFLQEVVVTGYSSQRKKEVTGAVTMLRSNNSLRLLPDVSGEVSESLSGVSAGVVINQNDGITTLVIRGSSTVTFDQTPLYIINGNVYLGDINYLDYSLFQKVEVLNSEQGNAIYGVRGANGVVIIQMDSGNLSIKPIDLNGASYDENFLVEAGESNGLRTDFSDNAFWQPKLVTNKEGKANFEVQFPDDITSWQTFYMAMNGHKQSGQSMGLIKSYKPFMAQLAVPRFLVQGDTASAIGKVLNYTPTQKSVQTIFEVNGKDFITKNRVCQTVIIDTLNIIASNDSLGIIYQMETEDGYTDGEKRTIEVHSKGMEETRGDFYVLENDTTLYLNYDSTLGNLKIYARADMLSVIEEEIELLIDYKYMCNEQMASKLKALLAQRKIYDAKEIKFKNDKKIDELIQLLLNNRDGLWGWWKDSPPSYWISLHVVESLSLAERMGYKVGMNKSEISDLLIWELLNSSNVSQKLYAIHMLKCLGVNLNYEPYISEVEKGENRTLNEVLLLMKLKQDCGMAINLEELETYQRTSLFGNMYFADSTINFDLRNSDLHNSLLAYSLFSKEDSLNNEFALLKIRNYLLEKRKNGSWGNTYESAQVITTLWPAYIKNKDFASESTLTVGDKVITQFPFEQTISPTTSFEISKTGTLPIYLTAYQKAWISHPPERLGDFEIVTSFDNESKLTLEAGKEVKLMAKVNVKKDATYVMINLPIPGGCSYAEKKNYLRNEVHREYFKNETSIFCENLPAGEYTFEVHLIPRFSGTYTLNPAKIELMYYPIFNANNALKSIVIN